MSVNVQDKAIASIPVRQTNGPSLPVFVTPISKSASQPVFVAPVSRSNKSSNQPVSSHANQRPVSVLATSRSQLGHSVISKLVVKAVTKLVKPPRWSLSLRNIKDNLFSCDDVKGVICNQLDRGIITDDFDIGYVNGIRVIIFRTKADLVEFWSEVRSHNKAILLCDGLKESKSIPDDEDEISTSKDTKKTGKSVCRKS